MQSSRPTIESWFPNLSSEYWKPTSEWDSRYNCIGWAAGETHRRWWPHTIDNSYFWPLAHRREEVPDFIDAFATIGYQPCSSRDLEVEFEKVALYVDPRDVPTHMARQLCNGLWTSKLGVRPDDIVHHSLIGLEGTRYGRVFVIMQRPW